MRIEIELTRQPIPSPWRPPAELAGAAGAVVEFWGLVRAEEGDRIIAALDYEAYEPMAERLIRRTLKDLERRHPCMYCRVTHRLGVVPVGEAAVHMAMAARHRAEALAMIEAFLRRLKQDIPIWKCRALDHCSLTSGQAGSHTPLRALSRGPLAGNQPEAFAGRIEQSLEEA
jgi:molybdopterin synthase catalytic subunit